MKRVASRQTTHPDAFPDVCISQQIGTELVRRGISPDGVRQLMAGEMVAFLADRWLISQLVRANVQRGKGQDIEVENDETHWVGHDRKRLQRQATMTFAGLQQCLAGLPVTAASDRQALWATVCAIFSSGPQHVRWS